MTEAPERGAGVASSARASPITRDDVRTCIELMLGRTPDEGLVDYHLELNFPDRAALGRYMMSTTEFDAYRLGAPYSPSDFGDEWRTRTVEASIRKAKLAAFGPMARGVWLEAEAGSYVVDPEDSSVSAALLSRGVYGAEELAMAVTLLPEGGRALIVGTHIGALAIPLSKRCRLLDAVEANPRTLELLRANLKLNDCSNVTLLPIAASSRTETLEFLISRHNSGGSKRKPLQDHGYYYDNPEVVTVPARALDDVVSDPAYDLVLMDCEGSEYFALQGMKTILARSEALAIEFLSHHINNVAGVSLDAFADLLEPHYEWLYVPGRPDLVPRAEIRAVLRDMYARAQDHDAIYFFKGVPDALKARVRS